MKIVVINPTYNERENIGPLIEEEQKVFKRISKHEMYILVVDDSSPDETHKVVEEKMKKFKNLHLVIGGKQGLGAAYVRGMDYAVHQLGADVIFEMDADFSHDPEKIPEFLEKIDQGYDFVIGSRYIKGGSIPQNWGIHRKIFSIFGNFLVRSILGILKIHDWTSGYRAIKKEFFLKTHKKLYGFAGYTFQVAFLYYAFREGAKVAEVPINFIDRKYGKSKIAPLHYITTLLLYVSKVRLIGILHSPFPKYAITGFSGYIITAVTLEFLKRGLKVSDAGLAASLAGELSIIWNFTLNNFWSFSAQKITSPIKIFLKFLQFNLISFGSVVIIGGGVKVGTSIFGDIALVRQISLALTIGFLVIPYSYAMYNIFVWKRWHVPLLAKLQKTAG